MLTEVKRSDVKALYPVPQKESHKGDNGRVLIVGGSLTYYGAPILAGMGALFGGADLVTLFVPETNFTVSRSYYPDFIVHAFPGDHLDARAVDLIVANTEKKGCLVMGPGLGDRPETVASVEAILKKVHCPTILDAQAIYALPRDNVRHNNSVLITPHAQEFANWYGKRLPNLLIEKVEMVTACAKNLQVNILLKNPTDIVASLNGETCINQRGNPGMTSGGTGDVLAGFVGSLAARGLSLYNAARIGVFILCTAGDDLMEIKGTHFTATDLALQLPYTIHHLTMS